MLKMKKQIRKTIIVVLSCLALLTAGLALSSFIIPRYEQITDTVLEVQTKADISYKVHMKDNPVFGARTLEAGGYFLKPFTDYIDVECSLSASSDLPIELEAETGIDVVLVSQMGSGDEAEVIWEKTESYAASEISRSSDGILEIKRSAKLDFKEYDALIDELMEEYELVTDYYLKVLFSTTVSAEHDGEVVEKLLTTELIVPFSNQIFSINGANKAEEALVIEEETQQRMAPEADGLILYGAVFITLVALLLLTLLKTKPLPKPDDYTMEVANIFKKYGNRLAGLSEAMAYQTSIMISIDKIEDMVKIADEIGQTIFYFQVEDDSERKIEFYIFDESRIFYIAMFGEL